jgi:hypothetical protein
MSVLHSLSGQANKDDALDELNGSPERRPVMARFSAIDRHPVRGFAILTLFYFVVVCSLSSLKLLWLDELITLHIARLNSPAAIWQALRRGVDPNPPLSHILVHYCRLFFGEHALVLRLPAMVGYWVGMLALFVYLERRLSPTWAMVGTIWLMTMGGFEYSYESRSYGIFFGLAMVAFYCWSRAVDPSSSAALRRRAIVGMILALSAGISTNYFAVIAFLPISIGEFVRTLDRALRSIYLREGRDLKAKSILREIDYPIWIAIALAATPLLAYRSMIEHSIALFAPYAWNKVSFGKVADSYTEMIEVVFYPIIGLFVLAGLVYLMRRVVSLHCDNSRSSAVPRLIAPLVTATLPKVKIPWHEAAAIGTFMAYPFLGYIIATVRGGMFSPRFVIPVCFGFAIAATSIAFHLFGNFSRAGIALLVFLSCWFVCRESYIGYWYEGQKRSFYEIVDRLPGADTFVPSDAPIVIPDPLLALAFRYYAPPAFASRAVFPVDFPAIRFYRHDDSPEENLWAGRNLLYRLPIEPLATLDKSAGQYLIITGTGNWLLEDLRNHHYSSYRLPIDMRAEAIGGFTPLAHGTPAFYISGRYATRANEGDDVLLLFSANDELPTSKALSPISRYDDVPKKPANVGLVTAFNAGISSGVLAQSVISHLAHNDRPLIANMPARATN